MSVPGLGEGGEAGSVRTSVCTPVDEEVLEQAIARLTVASTRAADDEIPGLVSERRAMREKLLALRHMHEPPLDDNEVEGRDGRKRGCNTGRHP